ncbi:MAG: hypothetical protein U7123_22750 [Potamolinea sp.]
MTYYLVSKLDDLVTLRNFVLGAANGKQVSSSNQWKKEEVPPRKIHQDS